MRRILSRAESFCGRFGLRVPILLAPMAGASAPSLSIAVANAGGLGACGVLLMQPEEILAWVREVRAGSNGPFQLNIWIHGCLQNIDAVGHALSAMPDTTSGRRPTTSSCSIRRPPRSLAGSRVRVDWPNPQGCWDWWGFTAKDFARKSGPQISAINAMIDRLAGATGVGSPSRSPSSCDPPRRG